MRDVPVRIMDADRNSHRENNESRRGSARSKKFRLIIAHAGRHPPPMPPGGIPPAGSAAFDDAMISSIRRIMTAASAALEIAWVFTRNAGNFVHKAVSGHLR